MLADSAPSDEVPATIQALLAARLDALPEEEREMVERASIIGLDRWVALGEYKPTALPIRATADSSRA